MDPSVSFGKVLPRWRATYLERALDTTILDNNPEKPDMCYHLGKSYLGLSERQNDSQYIEKAFLNLQKSATLIAAQKELKPNDPRVTKIRNLFAVCCARRFLQDGEVEYLDSAIENWQLLLQLPEEARRRHSSNSNSNSDRISYRTNLATAFLERSKIKGDPTDLDRAIDQLRSILESHSSGVRLDILHTLGRCFLERFRTRKEEKDLHAFIVCTIQALGFTSDRHAGEAELHGELNGLSLLLTSSSNPGLNGPEDDSTKQAGPEQEDGSGEDEEDEESNGWEVV